MGAPSLSRRMALRYFTLSSSLCAETIVGAWEVRLEKNMERVRAMLGISFYLYEVGSARAPKGFPWWTAGMKIDPRVPNTLIRKDYSIVNFTNIYSVSTQIRYLSKPQKWYSRSDSVISIASWTTRSNCPLFSPTAAVPSPAVSGKTKVVWRFPDC